MKTHFQYLFRVIVENIAFSLHNFYFLFYFVSFRVIPLSITLASTFSTLGSTNVIQFLVMVAKRRPVILSSAFGGKSSSRESYSSNMVTEYVIQDDVVVYIVVSISQNSERFRWIASCKGGT